jgi:hypothetical protein
MRDHARRTCKHCSKHIDFIQAVQFEQCSTLMVIIAQERRQIEKKKKKQDFCGSVGEIP